MERTGPRRMRSSLVRGIWLATGLTCVALGVVGVVVPGLPTTVFFIGAAACFTRSSPRLESWVLGLPGIGAAVRDHRAGLGMPRRAKVIAGVMIVAFSAASVVVIDAALGRIVVAVAAAVGLWVVVFAVPTRERVEAQRLSGAG